jgi:hypothetical protein
MVVVPTRAIPAQPSRPSVVRAARKGWAGSPQPNAFPRFTTPGTHTHVQRFQPQTYLYAECCAACGMADLTLEFEGRRVYAPEQIGNPVDRYVVFAYAFSVVEDPTAVPQRGRGELKHECASAR